jgi:hypothetical protein
LRDGKSDDDAKELSSAPSLDDHFIDDLMCPVLRMETVDAEMNFFCHDCAASVAND